MPIGVNYDPVAAYAQAGFMAGQEDRSRYEDQMALKWAQMRQNAAIAGAQLSTGLVRQERDIAARQAAMEAANEQSATQFDRQRQFAGEQFDRQQASAEAAFARNQQEADAQVGRQQQMVKDRYAAADQAEINKYRTHIRLIKNDPNLRPHEKEQMVEQIRNKMMGIEPLPPEPPKVKQEMAERVHYDESGNAWVMQPDGKIDRFSDDSAKQAREDAKLGLDQSKITAKMEETAQKMAMQAAQGVDAKTGSATFSKEKYQETLATIRSAMGLEGSGGGKAWINGRALHDEPPPGPEYNIGADEQTQELISRFAEAMSNRGGVDPGAAAADDARAIDQQREYRGGEINPDNASYDIARQVMDAAPPAERSAMAERAKTDAAIQAQKLVVPDESSAPAVREAWTRSMTEHVQSSDKPLDPAAWREMHQNLSDRMVRSGGDEEAYQREVRIRDEARRTGNKEMLEGARQRMLELEKNAVKPEWQVEYARYREQFKEMKRLEKAGENPALAMIPESERAELRGKLEEANKLMREGANEKAVKIMADLKSRYPFLY